MNRDTTLSMLGVPKAQRRQIETQYEGGIVKFIQDCMEVRVCQTADERQLLLARLYEWASTRENAVPNI